ncbi:MAG: DUF488 domain-containing protein [Bryobacterales bacterium]|nr:DUF488 domain-containing protein [Bryobacterales bacterium]
MQRASAVLPAFAKQKQKLLSYPLKAMDSEVPASEGKGAEAGQPPIIFTIGHSTRSIEDFVHLLKAHHVKRLVDVRTVPRSRHNPQFNRPELSHAMHSAGLHYSYMRGLGGFRRVRADSINTAWRNLSFRGFADYMQTPEFEENLEKLIELAEVEPVAIMCAEAVPWRCHRSLIADALLARGIEAREISSDTRADLHKMTPWAKVDGTRVTYPASESIPSDGG